MLQLIIPAAAGLLLWAALSTSFGIKGKKFVLVGPSRAGKSTLTDFLRDGIVTLKYEQTEVPRKFNGKEIKLKDAQLKIEKLADLPGQKDQYIVWKKQIIDSDIVCYLFQGDRVINGESEYIDRLKADIRHIKEWCENKNDNKKGNILKIFFIATHLDLLSAYQSSSDENKARIASDIWNYPQFEGLSDISSGPRTCWLAGSLADERGCKELMDRLISHVVAEVNET